MGTLLRCLIAAVSLAAGLVGAEFAPFEAWSAAVKGGDRAALARLYSAEPPAIIQVDHSKVIKLDEELDFWLKPEAQGVTAVNPKALDIAVFPDKTRVVMRVEGRKDGKAMVISMAQYWVKQSDGWRIAVTGRGQFSPDAVRRLPQPAKPNTSLYPDPGTAPAELREAKALAAKDGKRVLAIFGGNWCYDCHVLDATLRSPVFAPLVEGNYVVIHVNIGNEGKDNNDLAQSMGVALDRGVPSLAVLNADGSVVVAQRSGEFESTVKIGPEDVRAFLEKWKPSRK